MSPVRYLLFDLDGTLVDSSQTIIASLAYALGQLGISTAVDSPVTSVIGMPLLDIFRNQYAMTDDQAESAIAHYREHYDSLDQAGSTVYDRVREALSTLQYEGFAMFIATVKPTSIAEKVLSDFQCLIAQAQENFNGPEAQRLLGNLQKIQNLIYDSDEGNKI